MKQVIVLLLLMIIILPACKQSRRSAIKSENVEAFAREMVEFVPYKQNPLFSGTNSGTWDDKIRERGFILEEDGVYKMWYTGYKSDNDIKYLGFATSGDGVKWERYGKNPLFSQKWTEDMFVMKQNGNYYMFAEGENDIAHLLISSDGINWQEQGDLVVLSATGDTISGPYGTPSVLVENMKWYLFYERNDEAIWLATSADQKTWTNVQDEPVLKKGPGIYDSGAVACNQIVKFNDKYYMYYHGTSDPMWDVPGASSLWTSNVAVSTDLLHWTKYPSNPIVEGDHSSPILVSTGSKYKLYTMHPEVWLYLPE